MQVHKLDKKSKSKRDKMKHQNIAKVNLESSQCYFCLRENGFDESDVPFMASQSGLERHHVFGGNGNRKLSEKCGLVVKLCHEHHRTGKDAVHQNCEKSLALKKYAQSEFEKYNSRELFIEIFGRNYLD